MIRPTCTFCKEHPAYLTWYDPDDSHPIHGCPICVARMDKMEAEEAERSRHE